MIYVHRAFGLLGLGGLMWISGSPFHSVVRSRPWTLPLFLIPVILALFWPRGAAGRSWIGRMLFESPKWAFNLALFGTAAVLFSVLSWQLFHGIPHLDDSVAAVFSARLFSQGRLTWPLPQFPEFFGIFGVLSAMQGRPYQVGMYPPGWSAFLLPGVVIRAPWLINPLLGGGLALGLSELGERLDTRRVGRLAGILWVLSPFVSAVCATHLSHTATAFCLVWAWWAVLRLVQTEKWIYGAVAGCAMGMALLCRPATAFVVGVCLVMFFLPHLGGFLRHRVGPVLAVIIVIASVGVMAGYQHVSTGNWRTPGHKLGMGRFGKFGFVQFTSRHRHTVQDGAQLTQMRLENLNRNLLGWPFIGLPFALLPFLLGRCGYREYWLLMPFVLLTLFYAAFWYYEVYYPGRYLFSGVPFLFLLMSIGWVRLSEWPATRLPIHRFSEIGVASGLLFAITLGYGHYFQSFSPHHGDVETILPRVVRNYNIRNALVFMNGHGLWDREWNRDNDYYATGFQMNDLDLKGDVIYARDLGPKNIQLMDQYPGRRYYLYVFDRSRHKGVLYEAQRTEKKRILYRPIKPKDRWLHYDGQVIEVDLGGDSKSQ